MYNFEPQKYKKELITILSDIQNAEKFNRNIYRKIIQNVPKDGKELFSKDQLVKGYNFLIKNGELTENKIIISRIRMKPTRTISGVVPITVLTRPFHCPGQCIFCPLERNMPKSYIRNEPGCQRAERNNFSPYLQTYNRLLALKNIGHSTNKAELIILGGTWSYYPKHYQIWFIKEMFRALNDFGVVDNPNHQLEPKGVQARDKDNLWKELFIEHKKNETALTRSVGLSIETRPDFLNEKEVIELRKMGCTKIQIGVQSMDDKVLEMNKRGHNAQASIDAADILRKAGFKIQIHYMPNLYGSTSEIDIKGYKKLFEEKSIQPDELKLYPTSIIKNTELYDIWQKGLYTPYDEETLLFTMKECLKSTKAYTRLTRVVRDIPSQDIVTGNKKTNFRQIVEQDLIKEGNACKCIRCREIKNQNFDVKNLILKPIIYSTNFTKEFFLQYVTNDDKIIGFLRLSLPLEKNHFIEELSNSAIIREIHVYGEAQEINRKDQNVPQHFGIGSLLIQEAKKISKKNNFEKLSVISAIGTKEYYRKKGFIDGELYQFTSL